MQILLIVIFLAIWGTEVKSDCSMLNECSGHGECVNRTSTCNCAEGYGAASDIAFYKAPDCSQRTCPAYKAWADLPTSATRAHAYAECSNRGSCDRTTGLCKCWAGFEGNACQRMKCPNDCSGHGQCLSMEQQAKISSALPLAPNTYYEGSDSTWDEDMIFGCVCDSSWEVGLGNGQRQEPEWFGPDCSLRHCPSADNPNTIIDETNCTNVLAKNSIYRGDLGNLCQVDCANLGKCNYQRGVCKCFDGQFGSDCTIADPNAVYATINGD